MDIFAHGLWGMMAARAINRKRGAAVKKISPWLTAMWGVFPDAFAGAVPFLWLWGNVLLGKLAFSDFSRLDLVEHLAPGTRTIFDLWGTLYKLSHSLVIFFLVFGVIYFFLRRPAWELLGWPLHILFDIPTHSVSFYPTPFLWPLSDFHVNGISWGTPWFMVLNYSALLIVFLLVRNKKTVS